MTKDDIIRMAQAAGVGFGLGVGGMEEFLERFASLVAAHEREACAKLCESEPERRGGDGVWRVDHKSCALAIRTKGQA